MIAQHQVTRGANSASNSSLPTPVLTVPRCSSLLIGTSGPPGGPVLSFKFVSPVTTYPVNSLGASASSACSRR